MVTPAARWLAEVDALAVIAMDGANFDGAARYRLALYAALSPERVLAMVACIKAADGVKAALVEACDRDGLMTDSEAEAIEAYDVALAALDASHATGG